ncbi:MAG: hypothetical protein OES57_11245 [Acidimicrobiia bacterium]|nr:hypothetical protein [Acidimicrobiia bacterium]
MEWATGWRTEPLAVRARVLAHPVVLVLMTLWLLNDHVLKPTFGGLVTGKISDIAGLVVFPLVVGTLWPGPRPWAVGIVTTVVGYVAVNVWAPAADGADDLLTMISGPSRLTVDPTDLLVVPAVAGAWWLAAHPPGRRWASGVGRAALLVGLGTTLATSRIDDGTEHVLGVEADGNGVAIAISPLQDENEPPGCTDVWASANGRDWVRLDERSNCPRRPRRPATSPLPVASQSACFTDGQTCFRIVDDHIERSFDGRASWAEVWRWPADRSRYDWRWCPLGCAYESRGPHALTVATLDGTETVVVAMGHEGVLLSTDGAVWEPLGAGPTGDPASLTGGGPLFPEHLVVLTIGVVLLAITLQVGRLPDGSRRRNGHDDRVRRRHGIWLLGWGAVVLGASVIGGGAAFWRFSEGHIWLWDDALRWTIVVLVVVAVLGVGVAYLGRRATMALLGDG